MPYSNKEIQRLVSRGSLRTNRHGNWRQTYIDCGGMCVARINGSHDPCGYTEDLELHEWWGESPPGAAQGKFQQRILLCNLHHALLEDRAHQANLIKNQYHPSRLQLDANLEAILVGGTDKWAAKWRLDLSRWGTLAGSGPEITVPVDSLGNPIYDVCDSHSKD